MSGRCDECAMAWERHLAEELERERTRIAKCIRAAFVLHGHSGLGPSATFRELKEVILTMADKIESGERP